MKMLPVTRPRHISPTMAKPPVIIEAGTCTPTFDNVDAATVGATLRMLSASAPQPEVRERMLRVGALLETAARGGR
jgi:hypothetical protein